jgi:hypothetical protein
MILFDDLREIVKRIMLMMTIAIIGTMTTVPNDNLKRTEAALILLV